MRFKETQRGWGEQHELMEKLQQVLLVIQLGSPMEVAPKQQILYM